MAESVTSLFCLHSRQCRTKPDSGKSGAARARFHTPGRRSGKGHGPALLSMEANGRCGSNLAARFQSRERPELVLAADRSTSREGLDFDESTAVDPTQQPAARAI